MKHKHHIVPRYEGGSDFAENIVELTVTQHAMWHFAEWQRKGSWKDRLAWRGLVGLITSAEATREAQSLANKGKNVSEETRKKQSESMKKQVARDGLPHTCEDFGKRVKQQWQNYTVEERDARRKKHSDAAKLRWAKYREEKR